MRYEYKGPKFRLGSAAGNSSKIPEYFSEDVGPAAGKHAPLIEKRTKRIEKRV
jgi:hypothetical protein